jgi:hypothetical protein
MCIMLPNVGHSIRIMCKTADTYSRLLPKDFVLSNRMVIPFLWVSRCHSSSWADESVDFFAEFGLHRFVCKTGVLCRFFFGFATAEPHLLTTSFLCLYEKKRIKMHQERPTCSMIKLQGRSMRFLHTPNVVDAIGLGIFGALLISIAANALRVC